MEELYESDVMWPDSNDSRPTGGAPDGRVSSRTRYPATEVMDIPNRVRIPRGRRARWNEQEENNNDDDDADDTEFTPPHILTSRSGGGGSYSTRKVAFSLCSGQGRTLKGRDLSYVRNSVLRMTGFLEG